LLGARNIRARWRAKGRKRRNEDRRTDGEGWGEGGGGKGSEKERVEMPLICVLGTLSFRDSRGFPRVAPVASRSLSFFKT